MSISDSIVIINGTVYCLYIKKVDLNLIVSFGLDNHVQLVIQSILDHF